MPVPESLRALAPAKINLVLEVLGKREDGYHEVDTVLQTLELADEVGIEFDRDAGLSVTGLFADGTPGDGENLVMRAADQLGNLVGEDPSRLHITLDKRIPAAGGLGGGASDAATTLRLLQRAWPSVTRDLLFEAANAIGSDVPFFFTGGTARATGRGERVGPVLELADHGVVLFAPGATLERKTARLFAALDAMPFDDGSVAAAWAGNPPVQIRTTDIYNAFERVAFDMFPGLASLWEDLETRVGEPIRLAGAGPTLFWIGPMEEASSVAAKAEGLPCTVIQTRTSPSLWRR